MATNLDATDPAVMDQKAARLLSLLDQMLTPASFDQAYETLGETAFGLATNLQFNLRMRVLDFMPASARASGRGGSASPPRSAKGEGSPLKHSFTAADIALLIPPEFYVTPWESAKIPHILPALPPILDATLEAGAFIHQGYTAGTVTDLSYERMEWIGDSFIYFLASVLISQTFPSLLPGKSTQLRERLVKNVTLAKYAREYGFDERAKLPADLAGTSRHPKDQDKIKILGDIFEAYVAAVIISDRATGIPRVTAWLKALWGMTLRQEIIEEEKEGIKFSSPLWNLRGNVQGPVQGDAATPAPLNPKEALQKLLGAKGIKIKYKDIGSPKKDKDTKLPLFTVGVYLTGWNVTDHLLGTGTANGKKDAGMKAAKMALDNKQHLAEFIEQKRIFDAQPPRNFLTFPKFL